MISPTEQGPFSFFLPTRIYFGEGCAVKLPELLQSQGWDRVGVVRDHNLRGVQVVEALLTSLRARCQKVVLENCGISEPTYVALEQVRGTFASLDLQAIIGIGGGSALDMAKAMAVLARNRGPALSYRGFDKMTESVLPIIAVPTTAGTGSEVTPNASFVDDQAKVKMGINGEAVRPRFAFLDPALTLSCPLAPTRSAALDSLVHATEAFVAKKSNPMARLFAREGFEIVFGALPKLLQDLHDARLRTQVMYGAFLSGVALMHSGTGPAAALSYPLGVHYQVPHGIGGAIFLPHVVQYNVEQGCHDYGLLVTGEGSLAARAKNFVGQMFAAWARMAVPLQLREVNPHIDRSLLIKDTLGLAAALEQNPVPFGATELGVILGRMGPVG